MNTILRSQTKEVNIGEGKPLVIIGEKINPTGWKKLGAALSSGDFDYVHNLVLDQISWGADVLDVNVGVPGCDEVSIMKQIVQLIANIADIPLCIDSANNDVIKAGLSVTTGKALVNSVSGETKKLQNVLPLVKEHGAAVIGLTMDENGIPGTAEERVVIAEKILQNAIRMGIPEEDVVIDPLVLTVGSDSRAANITLQAIDLIRKNLGVNINVGASNVSFGLPDRTIINQSFLSLCMLYGASCAITDPQKMGQFIKATDLLLGRDDHSLNYLKYYRACEKLRLSAEE